RGTRSNAPWATRAASPMRVRRFWLAWQVVGLKLPYPKGRQVIRVLKDPKDPKDPRDPRDPKDRKDLKVRRECRARRDRRDRQVHKETWDLKDLPDRKVPRGWSPSSS